MGLIATSGSLPATIVEDTDPWEWMGVLQLLANPAEVRFMDIYGFGENFFDARFDAATGLIYITPLARISLQTFQDLGMAPEISFTLRFFLTNDTVAYSATTFTVTVVGHNQDVIPPQALEFATGGEVQAGLEGAVIGRLQVTDPDTETGFIFTIGDSHAWMFEVVDYELRLRPGMAVDLADGPVMHIPITVSDGSQSQAFLLPITVLPDPAIGNEPINLLVPGMEVAGLRWASADRVAGFVPIWEVDSVSRGGELMRLDTRRGESVWFEEPVLLDLTSGYVDFRANSPAARMWLAWETVLDRPPNLREMASSTHRMALDGLTEVTFIRWLVESSPESATLRAMNNRDFVTAIYEHSSPFFIGESAINWHAGRLDNGIVQRWEFVRDIMNWRTRFDDFARAVDDGFYVPRLHVTEIGALRLLGMDQRLGADTWEWYLGISNGSRSLLQLAQEVGATDAFFQKWAPLGWNGFLSGFYEQALGRPLSQVELDWWFEGVQTGRANIATFMTNVVNAMSAEAPLRQLPEGSMFDVVW